MSSISTSNLFPKHLVHIATAKHMQAEKRQLDADITIELDHFQALIEQKASVIKGLEDQLRTRYKVNAKRKIMYANDIKDRLKQGEDKMKYARMKAEQKQQQRDRMCEEMVKAEQELAALKAKQKSQKDRNEEKANLVRETREALETAKAHAIAFKDARNQNMNLKIA